MAYNDRLRWLKTIEFYMPEIDLIYYPLFSITGKVIQWKQQSMNKDKTLITFGYNHLEPGHPDNPKPFRTCGALTHGIEARGKYCLRPAGAGTSHAGVGRCKLHGGVSLVGPDSPTFKLGRYAHVFKGRLKEHYEQIGSDETNPLDLVPELQVQRVMLSMALDRLDTSPKQPEASHPADVTNVLGIGNVDDDSDDEGRVEMVGDGGGRTFGVEGYPVDIPYPQFSTSGVQDSSIKPPMLLIRSEDYERVMETLRDITTTVTRIIASRNKTALARADIVYLFS